MREMLDHLLRDAGYRTVLWPCGKDAHQMIRLVKPGLIIMDMWLERPAAGEMVLGLREGNPATQWIPLIISSGNLPLLQYRSQDFRQKGYVLVEKPFDVDDLRGTVAAFLGTAHAREAEPGGDDAPAL